MKDKVIEFNLGKDTGIIKVCVLDFYETQVVATGYENKIEFSIYGCSFDFDLSLAYDIKDTLVSFLHQWRSDTEVPKLDVMIEGEGSCLHINNNLKYDKILLDFTNKSAEYEQFYISMMEAEMLENYLQALIIYIKQHNERVVK